MTWLEGDHDLFSVNLEYVPRDRMTDIESLGCECRRKSLTDRAGKSVCGGLDFDDAELGRLADIENIREVRSEVLAGTLVSFPPIFRKRDSPSF